MNWWVAPLISGAILAFIGGVFLTLHLLTRVTPLPRGYAPGWQARCTRCDSIRDAAELGMIRVWAASVGKRLFGYCSNCRGFRWIAVEKKPEAPPAADA